MENLEEPGRIVCMANLPNASPLSRSGTLIFRDISVHRILVASDVGRKNPLEEGALAMVITIKVAPFFHACARNPAAGTPYRSACRRPQGPFARKILLQLDADIPYSSN
jgi:hypothetical protein